MAASSESDEETFSKVSVIRGHHVYKLNWTPIVGQNIEVHAEPDNIRDPRAVATYLDGNVVGHLATYRILENSMVLSSAWRYNFMRSYWYKKVLGCT